MAPLRIDLAQDGIFSHWYKVVADMPDRPVPTLGIVESLKHLPKVG